MPDSDLKNKSTFCRTVKFLSFSYESHKVYEIPFKKKNIESLVLLPFLNETTGNILGQGVLFGQLSYTSIAKVQTRKTTSNDDKLHVVWEGIIFHALHFNVQTLFYDMGQLHIKYNHQIISPFVN